MRPVITIELDVGKLPFVKVHQCSVCRREGFWSDTWCWYGSHNQIDHDRGEPITVMCSQECRAVWHKRNEWRFAEGVTRKRWQR